MMPIECWFIFQQDQLLMTVDRPAAFPDATATEQLKPYFIRQYSIGTFHHGTCYCAEIGITTPLPKHITPVRFRKVFETINPDWFNAATKAYSIIQWDKNHQYCGRCSHPTIHKIGTFERFCQECGLVLYPRISPSVIVRIRRDDHILMARSYHYYPGVYALIAGFVEAGENAEETVYREVQEEVGLEIKNLHYVGSQAWPFPDSLMLAFTADYAAGEINIDHKELENAGWYRYDNLPGLPSSRGSIARKLIDDFVNEMTKKSAKS